MPIPVAMYFKVAPKGWSESALFLDLPFLDQMGLTSLITMGIIALPVAVAPPSRDTFRTEGLYNVGAFAVLLVLVALYAEILH